MKKVFLILFLFLLKLCIYAQNIELIVLGTAQDAGSPQIACIKECCTKLTEQEKAERLVVSLGLVDHMNAKTYLFEATPDMVEQFQLLQIASKSDKPTPDGIFLSHAHIGHYAGLMYLGREAMNAKMLAVYSMPKMLTFLSSNQPWKQLIDLNNIDLQLLQSDKAVHLSEALDVIPILVPHRDELSETVGYKIIGPNKTALFIPDIDKWEKWDKGIIEEIEEVDYAFLDATFYDGEEIKARDLSEIPHPFVIESMELLKNLSKEDKAKVYFIHFNHTNALLNEQSNASKQVETSGFHIARKGMKFTL